MTLFWKIIIASAVVLVIGWIAYGIWEWRERKLEKQRPVERSQRYQQATSSVADYAKKLAEFKKPTYKREDSSSTDTKPPQG
jgi:predicted negative regulator of RcsB-dependent stress response